MQEQSTQTVPPPIAPRKSAVQYNSNPFTLAFDALGRFFSHNAAWAAVIIVIGFLGFMVQIVTNAVAPSGGTSTRSTTPAATEGVGSFEPAQIVIFAAIILIVTLVIIVAATAIGTFINGMFAYVALKSEEGKSVSLSEAFRETSSRFYRLFFASLLAALKITGWMLLFIVPGIIAAYRYTLLPYLIMDESTDEKGVRDAHTKTKLLVKGRLFEIFGIAFVTGIIPFVGELLGISGYAASYRQLSATKEDPSQRPSVHWLNYVGLALIAVAFLIFVLAAILIIALLSARS